MKIQVGKYTLYSDQFCFWIVEEQPIDASNKQAKRDTKEVRVGGYSTTLPNLLRSFCENQTKQSDAESMEELLTDLARIAKDMDTLNTVAVERGLKLLREKYDKTI